MGVIYVNVIKSLEDFDIESANGFEEEEGNQTPSEEELKQATIQIASEEKVSSQYLQ